MADRNMIEANIKIFAGLDKYCAERGDVILNSGKPRWIESSDGEDKKRLKEAVLSFSLSFGSTVKMARFDQGQTSLFCTVGLDLPEHVPGLVDETLEGGMLTAILSELAPSPNSSTVEIRDIIEVSDGSTKGYSGHDSELIASLFPAVRCFSVSDLRAEATHSMFFTMCLAAVGRHKLWMDQQLQATLALIAELNPLAIPYRTLCRSIFDTDPSAVFLALYRCLEALYAYSHTDSLMRKLAITGQQWATVAQKLEETLGWRPREEASLEALLSFAHPVDLNSILTATNNSLPSGANLISFVTKKIYLLRNSLVHYRAFHQTVDHDSIDWNRLCESTAHIVFDVYYSASS